MKPHPWFTIAALAVLLLGGCGGKDDSSDDEDSGSASTRDTPDKWMKDVVRVINDATTALETVHDDASARKAVLQLERLRAKNVALRKRADRLKIDTMSEARKERLMEKHKKDFKQAMERVMRSPFVAVGAKYPEVTRAFEQMHEPLQGIRLEMRQTKDKSEKTEKK